MTVNNLILLTFVGCGVVTWLPRILPFVFVKKIQFPKLLNDFLSYIPMCILTALFVQGLLVSQATGWPSLNQENLFASLPTIIVAIFTKSLMWTVIVGIATMAFLRFIM